MIFKRDPRDRRYRERLAGSTLVSIVLHVLLAMLLVSLVFNSSQEGATENVEGGSIVTLEQRTEPVANQPVTAKAAPPIAHVPRIAPTAQPPMAREQTQPLPQNRHELAVQAPTAPPNPREMPQRSPMPNPAPTQNVYEVHPSNELPAAPTSVPTLAPVAVSVRPPPTQRPSPAPTSAATARPSPKPPAPTPAATQRPSPAPPAPSPAVTTAAVAPATAAPKASSAPPARSPQSPAPRAGVPSPGPTEAAAVAKTRGTAPSPGPKGVGSPGPHAGTSVKTKAAPARPIELRPTPSPAPRPARSTRTPPDINARLRSLLPNNPVNPQTKQYAPTISLRGSLEPTPPPSVLAQTKYLYRSTGGSEARVEMWVTSIRKAGPTTICTGWLVRYPLNQTPSHAGDFAPANGTQISVGGGRSPGVLAPIVDGIVTLPCEGRLLVPYTPSPASSP